MSLVALTGIFLGCFQAGLMNSLGPSAATDHLVNFALADNGAHVQVSQESTGFPAVLLIDGITASASGITAEGWQQSYGKPLIVRRRASVG